MVGPAPRSVSGRRALLGWLPSLGVPDLWYAAYGSNLLRSRFALYVNGGRPAAGQRHHPGARDRRRPVSGPSLVVPGSMMFAGRSLRWRGGTSVLVPHAPDRALVRLWGLSVSQLADVQAQECGLEPGDVELDLDRLRSRGAQIVANRRYGRTVVLGEHRGRPIATFVPLRRLEPTTPGPEYLALVRGGLVECGLSVEDADRYLAARPGATGR